MWWRLQVVMPTMLLSIFEGCLYNYFKSYGISDIFHSQYNCHVMQNIYINNKAMHCRRNSHNCANKEA